MQTGKSRRSSRPPWPRATVLALIESDGVNIKADQMRHSAHSVKQHRLEILPKAELRLFSSWIYVVAIERR
jgi:hypothetical protein